MSVFRFVGKIFGNTVVGTVTTATSAAGAGVVGIASGFLGLFLLGWLLAIMAYIFMGKGDLIVILLLPVILVLSIFYGIFLLISALAGVLIGWLF